MKTRSVFGALVIGVALAACTSENSAGTSASQAISGGHGAAIGPTASPLIEVTVKNASYGILVVETTAGASCTAKAQLPSGGTVLASDFLSDRKVDEHGRVTWTYATPVAGAGEGSGRYEIACTLGDQMLRTNADFSIP